MSEGILSRREAAWQELVLLEHIKDLPSCLSFLMYLINPAISLFRRHAQWKASPALGRGIVPLSLTGKVHRKASGQGAKVTLSVILKEPVLLRNSGRTGHKAGFQGEASCPTPGSPSSSLAKPHASGSFSFLGLQDDC